MSSALLACVGGGLGDSLVASVVARALRTRYSRVDAVTLPSHRALLQRVPDVDDVLVDEGDENAVVEMVARGSYDTSVLTWATARWARIPHRARIARRVGQARRLYSWRFTDRVDVRSEDGDVTTPWSEILLDYARALGCDAPGAYPTFVPTSADEDEAMRSFPDTRRFLIVHPTNAIASQRAWPTSGWSALVRALLERFDRPIVLTGTREDAAINAEIARVVADDRVIDLAGMLGIGAFGAVARRADAYVGITTGTMHVAAAVGTPTVGIYPFQSDFPERWAPRGERTAVVRASYPCHAGDTKERCRDYACIAQLDVARIVAATQDVLEDARARHDPALHL